MKKIFAMFMLASVMMLMGVQTSYAKKVIVNTNGAATYHTWNKCKELKSGGLSAKVNEKDAQKEGKTFCPTCKKHEADVAADKAAKKAKKAEKKAKDAQKKAEKAQKEAAAHAERAAELEP